jgi:dTDP-4-dehydrorhamnose reductase
MRLLVTGTKGQVASALAARATLDRDVVCVGRPALDLAAPKDVESLFASHAPDVIVSAAAYTAVDHAEQDQEAAYAINARGAGVVARAAAALGLPLIHLSTDYVFDGSADRPLREDDPTGPLGVYGASKLEGEAAVARATADHVILRTAWVYGASGSNFMRTMLKLAPTREEIRVVADQHGAPTSASAIAAAIMAVADNLVARPQDVSLRGVFHMTASNGPASWADFAQEIFRLSKERGGPSARVVPITTAEYPTPARRPQWSLLDSSKLERIHGVRMKDWKDELSVVIDEIASKGNWA